jgi:hypothetical protein
MGLFSKLNVKAVNEAYCDVTAYNYLTDVVCISFSPSYASGLVSVSNIMQRAADSQAESLAQITGGQNLDYQVAMGRLSNVSASLTREVVRQLGEYCEVADLFNFSHDALQITQNKIIYSVRKGYLNMTPSDLQTFFQISASRVKEASRWFSDLES